MHMKMLSRGAMHFQHNQERESEKSGNDASTM